jgi:hypothetical protein
MRRTGSGTLEIYRYGSGNWERADRELESRFKFTGDWDPCSEKHVLEAIALAPPDGFASQNGRSK